LTNDCKEQNLETLLGLLSTAKYTRLQCPSSLISSPSPHSPYTPPHTSPKKTVVIEKPCDPSHLVPSLHALLPACQYSYSTTQYNTGLRENPAHYTM